MIREIGAALVFVACAGMGFRIARDYRDRPRHLRSLTHAMLLLQAEIEYSVTPLPQALARVAERAGPPADALLERTCAALQQADVSVEAAFADGIESCRSRMALTKQDWSVLREFGATLGTSDRAHQSQQFAVVLAHLNRLEQEARDSQRRNERLWQYLGVLFGLLIVILLY
ncbi:stage III sporulation protein SpoIIIAB [Alicyclobacillus kakegawensis]|uniref:stage III sporulation protein SpoIIIAB n=1 Tax=Alicyclobacillus kakegawensis TaxID=392012 RepID=UPI00082996EA|nr:stage III sporulation protein SpoIIIAB [Alicyclobacillus kakegawensis]